MYDRSGTALFTVNELAAFLGVGRHTVYRLLRQGDLVAVRVGDRLRFRPADVDAYLEQRRERVGSGP